jgi:hypothetical protein
MVPKEARASHPLTGPGPPILALITTIKTEEPQVTLTFEKQKFSLLRYWSQILSYSFLSQTQVL